ncbi:MAG: ORF6N domain-containing protein [Betaproteobacteria bacterium]|nr:ORF6N domain-containing protein [Betaproteobacteria bacterium]
MIEANLLPLEAITQRIMLLRDQKVLLDADLATLYGVPTKRFNEQIKRNLERFPPDFMFQLTEGEFATLRSHFATSNDKSAGRGGRRYLPYVFTEHGAIMAATVLNSPQATKVSVYVVRAFVKLREALASHRDLAHKLEELEQKAEELALRHDDFTRNTRMQLMQVFDAIRELMEPPETAKKRPIGFVIQEEKQNKRKQTQDG